MVQSAVPHLALVAIHRKLRSKIRSVFPGGSRRRNTRDGNIRKKFLLTINREKKEERGKERAEGARRSESKLGRNAIRKGWPLKSYPVV